MWIGSHGVGRAESGFSLGIVGLELAGAAELGVSGGDLALPVVPRWLHHLLVLLPREAWLVLLACARSRRV